jgi:23S rRNA (pseudouridine1915-N3)-methyltransferase
MLKIKVITQGKEKNGWLNEAIKEYEKRLSSEFSFEWVIAKNDKSFLESLASENYFIALDDKGLQFDSPAFAEFIYKELEKGGSKLTFCIGGAVGIPEKEKKRAAHTLSLSPLTFTHLMTRLIFIEQIYRATKIRSGSPYVK